MDALLSPAELQQLQAQVLHHSRHNRPATSSIVGEHRSPFRGQGVELEDTRPYYFGDDVRHMHWRATARTGKAMTKIFREERQREVFVMLDRSATMQFGTRKELKAVTAARATAMLLFRTLVAKEQIAGLVADAKSYFFPPARSLDAAFPFLRQIIAPLTSMNNYPSRPSITDSLEQAQRVAARSAHIYVVSDFYFLNEELAPLLLRLSETRQVTALHVIDPGEEHLDDAGLLRVRSPKTGRVVVVDSTNQHLRQRYAEATAQRMDALKTLLSNARIHYMRMYTHHDTWTQLNPLSHHA